MHFTLGLCDPPEPLYLYVGQGESEEKFYLWYQFDIKAQKKTPIFQRGLTGLDTNFTKTTILALNQVADFTSPLTIAVAAGEETVVFGRVYNAQTRQRVKAEWNPEAPWLDLIADLQRRLGQAPVPPQSHSHPQHNTAIKKLRQYTGHSVTQVLSWLEEHGAEEQASVEAGGVQAVGGFSLFRLGRRTIPLRSKCSHRLPGSDRNPAGCRGAIGYTRFNRM